MLWLHSPQLRQRLTPSQGKSAVADTQRAGKALQIALQPGLGHGYFVALSTYSVQYQRKPAETIPSISTQGRLCYCTE